MKICINKMNYFMIYMAWFVCSCKKFVQIPAPVTQLVTTSTFSNSGSATAAVTSLYTQMQFSSFNMSQTCGLLSDELNIGLTNNTSLIHYFKNAMASSSGTYAGPWVEAYKYIYQANTIIEQLDHSNALNKAIKDQLEGEAKFVRGFWFFYLVNCYGDIPLVLSSDYTINANIARSPKNKVYQQIVADLTDAENLLSSNYVDGTDTTNTSERVRPTKWAAISLLARVYLYTKDFVNAEKMSTIVINNNSVYGIVDSLNDVFKANSKETIWQLAVPLPTTINTQDGYNFILIVPPASGGTANTSLISSMLLDSFETGDLRRIKWIGAYTTKGIPAISYYFPYKYKVYRSSNVTEYTMILRLAEQYLIRAEARAQQGSNLNDAIADLNMIRHRAGLADYMGTIDKTSILAAILHEREVEFFCEWGHRWFDLIRTGNSNAVMSVITPLKGGDWSSDWQLFPIPQGEINLDHNLIQNPGYL